MTQDFECQMAELANKHREAMRGMTAGKAAGYVKRVLESWGIYRYLYDHERPFIELPDRVGGPAR